ncbi:hypothetical protein LLEC1_01479 [Akanthomyces lecanii]|uniref:DUF866 domain-containing protein n=1 Tax=Cordyceps confragosa TaxID=2714763 RepID=A0A179I3I1_CORDF|nr:hypothetical protein LLEC1_01479 [Akanthomyces lecanii]
MSGSRGEANFVWRCKNCKRESTATVKAPAIPYQQHEPAKAQKGEWLAEGIDSGSKFSGIELIDGEWYDYDEKAGEEVSIKDITWEIRRA